MDKILRINVGASGGPKVQVEPVGKYAGLGGRGMTSTVVYNEVPANCHALGPENKLVISSGMMAGSAAASSGRISVGCKSPLTGGLKESNAGGTAGQYLARLGYAAIIIEGERQGDDLYKVIVSQNAVKIEKANDCKMLTNYQLVDKVKASYGDSGSLISIGTAGEMLMSNSTICVTDPEFRATRHAGRGGVGAVMGSKGIKFIYLDIADAPKMRIPVNAEAFKVANKKFVEGLQKHPVTGQGLAAFGTNVLTGLVNEVGGYPAKNFAYGRADDSAKALSAENLANLENTRPNGTATHGCHKGCVIKCSGIFTDAEGNFVTKQPEYETVWAHGGNCCINDLDAIALMDRLDDDYGFDTIEMGCSIAVLMEAGVIAWGDTKAAINLIHEAGKGTPLGRIIGAGTATVARCYGIERAPVVKGQSMPAYDPRAIKGIGVTYATTTQGADHTAGYSITANVLGVGTPVDPLKTDGQVELSRNLQIATAAIDASGYCLFIAFAILDQAETFAAMIDSMNAMHGTNMDVDAYLEMGKDILRKEREFNEKAGIGKNSDRLPLYFSREVFAPHNATFNISDEELDSLYNF